MRTVAESAARLERMVPAAAMVRIVGPADQRAVVDGRQFVIVDGAWVPLEVVAA